MQRLVQRLEQLPGQELEKQQEPQLGGLPEMTPDMAWLISPDRQMPHCKLKEVMSR